MSRAREAVAAFLSAHPWARDAKAGENSLRFNLMCEAGLEVIYDTNPPDTKRLRFTGENVARVVEQARGGDRIAHEALCAMADHLTTVGQPLPLELQGYVVEAVQSPPPSKRGRHPVSNLWRDECIFQAVEIALAEGVQRTRNAASQDESACSIVSEELVKRGIDIKERHVDAVWDARREVWIKAGVKIASDRVAD